jgi:hypothetical protein
LPLPTSTQRGRLVHVLPGGCKEGSRVCLSFALPFITFMRHLYHVCYHLFRLLPPLHAERLLYHPHFHHFNLDKRRWKPCCLYPWWGLKSQLADGVWLIYRFYLPVLEGNSSDVHPEIGLWWWSHTGADREDSVVFSLPPPLPVAGWCRRFRAGPFKIALSRPHHPHTTTTVLSIYNSPLKSNVKMPEPKFLTFKLNNTEETMTYHSVLCKTGTTSFVARLRTPPGCVMVRCSSRRLLKINPAPSWKQLSLNHTLFR